MTKSAMKTKFFDENTLVIYGNIEILKKFFESFGLSFKEEQHGEGPIHYAAETKDGLVFEVYPK